MSDRNFRWTDDYDLPYPGDRLIEDLDYGDEDAATVTVVEPNEAERADLERTPGVTHVVVRSYDGTREIVDVREYWVIAP